MKNSLEIVKQLEAIRDSFKEEIIFDNEYREHWQAVNQRFTEAIHILWNYDKGINELETELKKEREFKKEFKENPQKALEKLRVKRKKEH